MPNQFTILLKGINQRQFLEVYIQFLTIRYIFDNSQFNLTILLTRHEESWVAAFLASVQCVKFRCTAMSVLLYCGVHVYSNIFFLSRIIVKFRLTMVLKVEPSKDANPTLLFL